MLHAVDVILERESANDVDATVVEVLVASGAVVSQGDRILDVETSKAVQEITAPATGILLHALSKGDRVTLGRPIAQVVPEGTAAATAAPLIQPAPVTLPAAPGAASRQRLPRLSRDAAVLAAKHGLIATDFDRDLVSVADVRQRLGLTTETLQSAAIAVPAPTVPPLRMAPARPTPVPVGDNVQPVASHKREEMEALSRGAGASMLSVLGATVGFGDLMREDEGFFTTKIVDLVAYEASRLMRDHPKLNAAWRDGYIEFHQAVHAGIAFDNGGRLVVYGVENSDTLELLDLQDDILEGFKKYARNRLTAKELTRATFTVTDLSGTGVDFMLPLLPHGQSCILGITNGGARGFALHMGFDHRVTEGLDAARFLSALRDRVVNAVVKLYRPANAADQASLP